MNISGFFNPFSGKKGAKEAGNQPGEARAAVYGPGLFFIILGVVTVVAPKFILAVLAAFFVFIGVVLCWLGWKFFQLQKTLRDAAEKFQGQVRIQGVGFQNPFEFESFEEEDDDDDDVIIH